MSQITAFPVNSLLNATDDAKDLLTKYSRKDFLEFDLYSLAGLISHLKFDDGVYVERTGSSATTASENAAVGTIQDLANGSYLVASSDGERPQQTKHGLYFDGSAQLKNTDSSAFSSLTACTICWKVGASYGMPFSAGSGLQVFYLSNFPYVYVANGTTIQGQAATTEPHVLTVVYDSTLSSANRVKIYIDGEIQTTTLSGTVETATGAGTGYAIGDYYPGGADFIGIMSEFVAYDRALTSSERQAVERQIGGYPPLKFGTGRINKDSSMILGPTANDNGALIIFCHGSSVSETQLTHSSHSTVNAAMRAAGYTLASANLTGENWGNAAGLVALKNYYDYLVDRFNPTRVIFWGESMGGCVSQKALVDARFSSVKGAYLTFPVCSIATMDYGDFAARIAGAYPSGYTGASPLDLTSSGFADKRLRYTHSAADSVVSKTTNTDPMRTLVSAYATESAMVTTTGDHGDASNYDSADMIAFFDRCV